jgi:hypothetical protein
MNYVLDSSALISAWNQWYRENNFPPIWTRIEALARDSRLIVPDAVLQELNPEDGLHRWLRERDAFIVGASNNAIQDRVRDLQARFPLLRTTGNIPGRHFADPFVIGTAQLLGATVVSHESAQGRRDANAIAIPDICAILEVPHIMFHRIVINEGWVIG